jgi:hypothetical protein
MGVEMKNIGISDTETDVSSPMPYSLEFEGIGHGSNHGSSIKADSPQLKVR